MNDSTILWEAECCIYCRELIETDAERNRRMNTDRTKRVRQELEWKQFISGVQHKVLHSYLFVMEMTAQYTV